MTTYTHDTVTVWVVYAPSEDDLVRAVAFEYAEDADARSAFSTAFRTGFYDTDFAEFAFGDGLHTAVIECARSWLTLDEQVASRLPVEGAWNGVYLVSSGAGEAWEREENRPPMPHNPVQVGDVTFKLVGTFPVIAKF